MSELSSRQVLSDDAYAQLWKLRCDALNLARITYRYHRKRQWFYGFMDKLTAAAALGGGVIVAGQSVAGALPMVGGIIAFGGLMALLVGYSDKRQCHKELAEEAMRLISTIEALPSSRLTDEAVSTWMRAQGEIDLKEPPNLKTLVSVCEWEQAVAEGHKTHLPKPAWWRYMYMHFGW